MVKGSLNSLGTLYRTTPIRKSLVLWYWVILLRETEKELLIGVLVKPKSKVVNISFDPITERFIVALKSPPMRGKANKELLDLLKGYLEELGYRLARLKIVRGHTSRNKIVLISGINPFELRKKLKALSLG